MIQKVTMSRKGSHELTIDNWRWSRITQRKIWLRKQKNLRTS